MKKLIFIALFGFLFSSISAQSPCGTNFDESMLERLQHNVGVMDLYRYQRGGTEYVPLQFHIVADSDGNGAISETRVFNSLKRLNSNYLSLGIQFYIQNEFNYLNKDILYSANTGTNINAISFQLSLAKVANAVNVFIVKEILGAPTPPSTDPTNVLGFYLPSQDVLVLQQSEVGRENGTFEHEMGHFFSLAHPFRGWDNDPWSADRHGNPVGARSPGNILNEFVDGSNCSVSGDLICDTPADYNLGFRWNGCNDYTGDCMDPSGDTLRPMEINYMGYFIGCDSYQFTPDQNAAILADFNSPSRNYIRNDYIPYTGTMDDPQKFNPVDTETFFSSVEFDWEAVEGARWYLLEIGRNQSITIGAQRYFVTSNSATIDDLIADRNYFWRVQAYGEYKCYDGDLSVSSFRTTTTTSTEDPTFVESFNVFPNPVLNNDFLTINLESKSRVQMDVELFGQNGQVAKRIFGQQINEGGNSFTIDMNGLSAGIYILKMQSAAGNIIRKITIL